jgi:hypothetical protein
MSDTHPAQLPTIPTSPNYDDVVKILQVFFPQYLNEDSPYFVAPDVLIQLIAIAEEARPWCLPESQQDFAQAMYTAYLVGVRNETSSGSSTIPVAGPITMEKEGDIQVQYATTPSGATSMSKRPASDPWDAWQRMWNRCGRGAIMTRFGDPVKNANAVTVILWQRAYNVWFPIW